MIHVLRLLSRTVYRRNNILGLVVVGVSLLVLAFAGKLAVRKAPLQDSPPSSAVEQSLPVGQSAATTDSDSWDAIQETSQMTLTISRKNPLHQSGVSEFTKQVGHKNAVKLLHDMKALRPIQASAIYHCPMDNGIQFKFTFEHPYVTVSARATGCSFVNVSGKSYWTTDAFWQDVSDAVGIAVKPLRSW